MTDKVEKFGEQILIRKGANLTNTQKAIKRRSRRAGIIFTFQVHIQSNFKLYLHRKYYECQCLGELC